MRFQDVSFKIKGFPIAIQSSICIITNDINGTCLIISCTGTIQNIFHPHFFLVQFTASIIYLLYPIFFLFSIGNNTPNNFGIRIENLYFF